MFNFCFFEENTGKFHSPQLSQSFSRVQIFATPWTATYQASLSIPYTHGLLKLMSIASVCHLMMSTLSEIIFFEIPYNWDCILLFFLWLSLLSVMPSSFIHVAINEVISLFFQWPSNIYLYMSHHIVLIHSPIERYSGCSYIKATVNNAAMNMGIHISLWENDFISFDYISRSGIMDHITVLF